MPRLRRPDGAEIDWQEQGEGPVVVLSNLGYLDPSVLAGLAMELARDHRVLSWHTRGTGASSHTGPYDVTTDAGDLAAVVAAAGGRSAVAVGTGDGADRAIRAAAAHPELIDSVVVPGSVAIGASGGGGLASSGSVLDALLTLLENDYRAGVHAFVSAGNPDIQEQQVQVRVDLIVAHCTQEAAVSRIRAWIDNDPIEEGRTLGDRLWLLHHQANPWFLETTKARELLPDAHHEEVDDGPFSRPDLTASAVRRLTAAAR